MNQFFGPHAKISAVLIIFIAMGASAFFLTPYALTHFSRGPLVAAQGSTGARMVRFLIDNRELEWYRAEGLWFAQGFLPYRDEPYEYPVLATALFTLPALMNSAPLPYHLMFRFAALIAGFWLIYATWRFCKEEGEVHALWFLILPSVLYTIVNRFDVFPALALQLSLIALWRRRFSSAWLWLGVSFLLKWYAGLLIPLYLLAMFEYAHTRPERTRAFQAFVMGVAFIIVGHIWLLPLGGSVLDAINPYAIHFVRPPEVGSLPAAVLAVANPLYRIVNPEALSLHDPAVAGVGALSTIFQLMGLAAILAFLARPRHSSLLANPRAFAHVALIVVGCFVMVSRVYSQQWILWLAPLLVLTSPSRRAIVLFVVFDLVNFILFPILFGAPPGSGWYDVFTWLVVVRSFCLGWLLVVSVQELMSYRGKLIEL